MRYTINLKAAVLVVAVVAAASGTAQAVDPYYARKDAEAAAAKADQARRDYAAAGTKQLHQKQDDRKYWEAYDARKAAYAAGQSSDLHRWAAQTAAGYGSRPVAPVYAPAPLTPAAAKAVAITQDKAARDAHFQQLMKQAAAGQSIRR